MCPHWYGPRPISGILGGDPTNSSALVVFSPTSYADSNVSSLTSHRHLLVAIIILLIYSIYLLYFFFYHFILFSQIRFGRASKNTLLAETFFFWVGAPLAPNSFASWVLKRMQGSTMYMVKPENAKNYAQFKPHKQNKNKNKQTKLRAARRAG